MWKPGQVSRNLDPGVFLSPRNDLKVLQDPLQIQHVLLAVHVVCELSLLFCPKIKICEPVSSQRLRTSFSFRRENVTW